MGRERPFSPGMEGALFDLLEGDLVSNRDGYAGRLQHNGHTVEGLVRRGLAERMRARIDGRVRKVVRVSEAGADHAEGLLQ